MRALFLTAAITVAVILVAVLFVLVGYEPAHAPAPTFTPIQLPTI